MTEKLYYQQPILTECDATVTTCKQSGDRYLILLDRTVIFPEGGGQISDRGFIEDAVCREAHEIDGEIWHNCDAPLVEGDAVKVRLVTGVRRDHTEQHTGEHILSGVAKQLFDAVNVGFHMAVDYCTIDLDKPLTVNELITLEREANLVVRLNLPIRTEIVDASQLEELELRKKADGITGVARIVYIDDGNVDSCTCCGTHFETTGSVGAVKITDFQKYKGGTRLWFACGGRAVNAACDMQRSMMELARRFSTSRDELAAAVIKQGDELTAAHKEIKRKTNALCEYMADKLIAEAEIARGVCVIVTKADGFGANDVKVLSERIAAKTKAVALVFGETAEGCCCYRMARSEGVGMSMRDLCTAVNAAINGKGGGSPAFAQGSAAAAINSDLTDMLKNYIVRVIKG